MPNRLKAIPRIAIAFLEHRISSLIGEKARNIITDDLIGFDKSQVNAYLQRQESDAAIDRALSIVGSKFRHNPRDQDLHEQMNALALSGNPAIEAAIHQFSAQPDVTLIEQAIWGALQTVNWKISLSQDEMERGVKRYLYELQLALLPIIPEVIIGSSVLRTEQKVDELAKQVAILVGREQSRLILSYKDTFEPLALPTPDALPEPTTLPPGSRLELPRNEVFTGREDELIQLAHILLHGSGQKTACISTGYGGIGKTQLAIEFAYRFGRYFQGVHWLSARSGRLEDDIAACGRQMGIDIQELEGQVNQTIATWKNSQPRLIIIDNAENPSVLERWWATFSDMRILITSRRTQWAASLGLSQLDLKELTPEQARDLLRKLAPRLKNVADGELDKIGEKLGFLPLALDLVGRYLKENPDLKPAKYLQEVEKQGNTLDHEALKAWFDDSDFMATDQQRNVIACFDLSWAQLGREKGQTKVNFLARKILRGCGYCAPNEPIPVQLLVKAFENDEDENAPSVRQALRRLFEVGLLRQTQEGEVGPTIHPLMAEYARLKDEADDESVLGGMGLALAKLAMVSKATGFPKELEIWRAHLQSMLKLLTQTNPELAGSFWNYLGNYHQMVANYSDAYAAFEEALRIDEVVFGKEHPIVINRINNLAGVLQEKGNLAGARAFYEKALRMAETIFGEDHPSVGDIINNIGEVLRFMGEFESAKQMYERTLSIYGVAVGTDHPSVAAAYNNIGLVMQAMADITGAQEAFEQALAIWQTTLGERHPQVAIAYNNLGQVMQAKGELASAYELLQQALSINESVFGSYHPNIARNVNNLGSVLQDMGDLKGAKAAYQRAVMVDKGVYGINHIEVAIDLDNLGNVLMIMDDLLNAKVAYEEALTILQAAFGEKHFQVAYTYSGLGSLYLKAGNIKAAKDYYERALYIFLQFFPSDHPNIEVVQENLDYVNRHLGE